MSYRDLRTFNPEYSKIFDTGVVVLVEKVGGGTSGYAYEGDWNYAVFYMGNIISNGSDYHSGTRKRHREVAEDIHSYFEKNGL